MASSADEVSEHIRRESASYVPRQRESISVVWDSMDDSDPAGALLYSQLLPYMNDDKVDEDGRESWVFNANDQDSTLAVTLEPASKRQKTSSQDDVADEAVDIVSTMCKRLVENNPNFAHVNRSVAKHMLDLLKHVRKKSGVSLASAAASAADLTADAFENLKDQQEAAYQILCQVPPFSYLPNKERRSLVQDLHQVEYRDGEVILNQNDNDDDVYVLAKGRVVMVDISNTSNFIDMSTAKFVGYLDAPAYFGEFATIFDASRNAQVISGASTTCVYRIAGKRFEDLFQKYSNFRLKLALMLRHSEIFSHIDSFVAIVRRAVAHDKLFDFQAILKSYRKMVPAIHANLHSSQLDIEGWTYAVRRLPDSITSTYVYLLSKTIPMPFMHSQFDLGSVQVKTVARRRQAFALDRPGVSGKLLVVMRENYSDVLDFLSLLCAHIHESAKLRNKLLRPAALDDIHSCLWSSKQPSSPTAGRVNRHYTPVSVEDQQAALEKLPLTQEEKAGLKSLWPQDFLYRIWDIITLHENIQIRSDLASIHVKSTDRWAEKIRQATKKLLSPKADICLLSEVDTHIISSNTTSVRNLISPYILKKRDAIQEWGKQEKPEIMAHSELSQADKLCALCNAYMKQHPESIKEQDDFDQTCFKTLRSTEMTGIQVELIDLDALEDAYIKYDIAPDPFLASCFPQYEPGQGWTPQTTETKENKDRSPPKRRLLINIDYAFGKQAEQLISALSLTFGDSLCSVGVMGKAGGLKGRRGDIIVAEYLVHQEGDEQTLIDNTGVDREALHTLSGRTVHSGGVLTVLGTLLQDTRLLNFYKKLYGCVSLEMEGSFYARELQRCIKARLLSKNIQLRFLYYVSDTPLSTDQTETLSQDLSITEVIPPQYAVTRGLLHPALSRRD